MQVQYVYRCCLFLIFDQELIDQLQEGIKDDLTKPDDMILICSFDEVGEYYHTNNIDFDFTPDRGICEINVRPEPEFIWKEGED